MEIISKSNVSSIIKKKKTIFKIIEEDNAKSIFNTRYNIELICTNFKKCIQCYHFVNTSPINETIWEDINAIIFVSSGINIYSKVMAVIHLVWIFIVLWEELAINLQNIQIIKHILI